MDSDTITKVLARDLECKFIGILAIDEVQDYNLSRCLEPYSLIVNTDKRSGTGKHWLALYKPSGHNQPIEIFDSLGKPLCKPLVDMIEKDELSFKINQRRVQAYFSDTCGYYVLHYLFLRSQNISFDNILNNLGNNLQQNDQMVKAFVHSIYPDILNIFHQG